MTPDDWAALSRQGFRVRWPEPAADGFGEGYAAGDAERWTPEDEAALRAERDALREDARGSRPIPRKGQRSALTTLLFKNRAKAGCGLKINES